MPESIEYWNLVTGDRAQESPTIRDYFELAITQWGDDFFSGTSEGEFLCAFGFHQTFKEAWFDSLTYTTVGGSAYQAHQNGNPIPTDQTQSEPFDPYAGNLDLLLGY